MTPDPSALLDQIVNGSLPTGTVEIDQDFLKEAADLGQKRLEGYKLFEEYYEGEQKVELPDRIKQFLERAGLEWNENFIETIVDTFAGRMSISGFTTSESVEPEPEAVDEETGEPATPQDPLADWIQEYVWEKNRCDAKQAIVHFTAIQKGDSFLLTDWDNAKACPRLTFNRPEVIKPVWDDDGNMVYCVKLWDTQAKSLTNPAGIKIRRMNIYYPDRVEKYFRLTTGEADKPWSLHLDDDDTTWPTAWLDVDGQPLGIPVFHFANKPTGKHWGRSEIKSAIPQQNGLNKQILDLITVMDTMAWPQRYVAGIENTDSLKTAPGEVWTTPMPGADFGQFEAASVEGPLAAIEAALMRLSGRSRTPAHLLVMAPGGSPSGEALKTAESGVVGKAKYNATFWGDVWSDVMTMCIKLSLVYGGENRAPVSDLSTLTINVNWNDPETRNLNALLEALRIMKELGVSDRTILTMIPGIDANAEMKAKEMDEAAAGEAMMEFIDKGAQTPVPGRPLAVAERG